jgi:hypothetical protein
VALQAKRTISKEAVDETRNEIEAGAGEEASQEETLLTAERVAEGSVEVRTGLAQREFNSAIVSAWTSLGRRLAHDVFQFVQHCRAPREKFQRFHSLT